MCFEESGVTILSGCPTIPQPDSKFCYEHLKSEHPTIPGERLNSKSRKRLREHRKDECKDAPDYDFYIKESILEIKEEHRWEKIYS